MSLSCCDVGSASDLDSASPCCFLNAPAEHVDVMTVDVERHLVIEDELGAAHRVRVVRH